MSDTATRYSGLATVSIRYHEILNNYTAKIKSPAGTHTVRGVGLSTHDKRTISADGAEAFDKIAHAALSFAESDNFETGGETNKAGSGWEVSRRKPSSKIPKVPAGVRRAR